MKYRLLGRTGVSVGEIGLGTEYLLDVPRDQAIRVVHAALDHGINYFDLFWSQPEFRDTMGAAFAGRRSEAILAAHLGSVMENGQAVVGRDPVVAESFFRDFLRRYRTDYVDVLFLFNSNTQADYDALLGPKGLLEIAQRIRKEGAARILGFGGHNAQLSRQAVESGLFDVIIFPVNFTCASVPGNAELHEACARRQVGMIAMKPYAGGRLLKDDAVLAVEDFQMGRTQMPGAPTRFQKPQGITPVQCLSYALSRPGVSTVIPGCRDLKQLDEALACAGAGARERDFTALLASFSNYPAGQCVYCNHCLPCPAGIDIGRTLSLLDGAAAGITPEIRRGLKALAVGPAECIECGDCTGRCPFGVDVVPRMRRAAALTV